MNLFQGTQKDNQSISLCLGQTIKHLVFPSMELMNIGMGLTGLGCPGNELAVDLADQSRCLETPSCAGSIDRTAGKLSFKTMGVDVHPIKIFKKFPFIREGPNSDKPVRIKGSP